MFYSEGLQAGIALAVSEAKAVVCFVRDDEETSTLWEDEYFVDDGQLAQSLQTKSVLLRLTKDSNEAGFLTSFCPIVRFPTVVVIKNGMLREYIVPEISKDDFRTRLRASLEENQPAQLSAPAPPVSRPSAAPSPDPSTSPVSSTAATTAATPAPSILNQSQPKPVEEENIGDRQPDQTPGAAHNEGSSRVANPAPSRSTHKPQQSKRGQQIRKHDTNIQEQNTTIKAKPEKKTTSPSNTTISTGSPKEAPAMRQPATSTPPKQYRLQVRLFDGSSVRRSFTPSQTIRGDVRPWLDSLLQDEKRPYNLKHILTPLPNRTLTIAEEERTLEDLGLGSTANLVMIPINSYTEAYTGSGTSLPVRAAYSAYGLLSSAVGTATGLVGSFLGYNSTTSTSSETTPDSSSASERGARRPQVTASSGPRIRTLRDQREERGDSQFYNGNQLNFEPRRDTDER
ncbi:UBX domain protein [Aspergillus clavatus NRRL 1]|uniref:UBX domain-containing protein 2 n=1 Tax=Aspergillus clavatus (strain ATCC 1007 / CBS 513.65 / DSM 816 / NCTC 3887 / NRRL 1 / QM 1276 / 107) TaxID=344612 RepID=A1CJA4_ASPCL|nr:UBX domain protein [Aspergillus clavatus NRRL 1]EAW09228.1 UBX domain protein [Aspergillus clavatus NRRL 1]